LLDEVQKELSLLTNYHDPGQSVAKGEKVHGSAPDEIRKLFTLITSMKYDIQDYKNKCNLYLPTQISEEDYLRLELKYQILKDMMFFMLRQEFKIWNARVGLRSGFKVVSWTDEPMAFFQQFGDFFKL
jgi:hypothetical protein